MTQAEARTHVEQAITQLGLRGTIDVLVLAAKDAAEQLTTASDKLALHRAASDHRLLVQTSDKLYN